MIEDHRHASATDELLRECFHFEATESNILPYTMSEYIRSQTSED